MMTRSKIPLAMACSTQLCALGNTRQAAVTSARARLSLAEPQSARAVKGVAPRGVSKAKAVVVSVP